MTREEAIRRIKAWNLDSDDREVLAVIIPELAESEDERIRKRIRLCLDECVHSDIIRDYERDECLAYLEKQKEQKEETLRDFIDDFPYSVQKEQKPAEWSEDDEDSLNRVIRVLEDNDSDWKELSDWLKSLRPSWKPSVEQTAALNSLLCHGDFSYIGQAQTLQSLYIDLMKL